MSEPDPGRHRSVLLTVSGRIDPALRTAIGEGRRPRADYIEMADAFDADLLDYPEARRTTGRMGRFVARLAGDDVLLAWACFRRRSRYDVVFTDGEQVGMPFAALCRLVRRRPRHVMIGHLLSTRPKVFLHRALRLQRCVDLIVVYASAQRRVAVERLGYADDRVLLTSFMVDTVFWRPPAGTVVRARPMICSAGQEFRDYPTLVDAVRGLDVDVVLAAASPWSKRSDSSAGLELPDNVDIGRFDPFDLRQVYAEAAFVVVPLRQSDFQAGITTILEAMSMGKAVVCTRTDGQDDTLLEGVTGRYVPPGDAGALRDAIESLLADPDEAARLGSHALEWVRANADIEVYADRLAVRLRAIERMVSRGR